MFKVTRLYIGPLEPRSKTKMEFPYEGIHVLSMQTSCGCTDPTNDPANGVVSVMYEAKDIPPHLKLEKKNEYTTNQTITIKYVDKEVDREDFTNGLSTTLTDRTKVITLVFTARIVDKTLKFE